MFQLKLYFELECPFLPKELDRLIVSYFKAATQKYSQEFFESLYDKSKSILKGFTWSCYLPGAQFQNDRINLSRKEFALYFSDADMGEAICFFNSFKLMMFEKYSMKGNSMRLKKIETQNIAEIRDSEIVIKMQSPLIVRKHNLENNSDIYYTFEQEEFSEALKENITIFLQRMGIDFSAETFSIQPIKGKKVVSYVFGRNIDSNIGIYKLEGKPELLNLLHLSGMGARRSSGHGKWELIL